MRVVKQPTGKGGGLGVLSHPPVVADVALCSLFCVCVRYKIRPISPPPPPPHLPGNRSREWSGGGKAERGTADINLRSAVARTRYAPSYRPKDVSRTFHVVFLVTMWT